MEIRILTVGKIKEKYLNDGIAEYAKRLSRYCRLTFCQVPDEKTPDKASDALKLFFLGKDRKYDQGNHSSTASGRGKAADRKKQDRGKRPGFWKDCYRIRYSRG